MTSKRPLAVVAVGAEVATQRLHVNRIIKRRSAMLAAAGALGLGVASRSAAQPTRGMVRIGVLGPDTTDASGPIWEQFVWELAQRGWHEGSNMIFVRRFGQEDRTDALDRAAAELVAQKVDLIYAARGTASALAAKKATSTIPVVFYSSADPVGLGVVSSLSHPGGNLTGNAALAFDTARKGLEILAEVAGPQLKQFAFLMPTATRAQPWTQRLEATLSAAAAQLGLRARFVEIDSVVDLTPEVERLVGQGVGAVMLFDFPIFRPHLERIAALFIRHRLPSYGHALAGFLINYGEPRFQLATSAAEYVDRILRGARPADLPVQQVSTFDLVVNLKTARAIGLKIPSAVMVRATQVIE